MFTDLHREMNRFRSQMDYFFNDFDLSLGLSLDDDPFLGCNQQLAGDFGRLALDPAEQKQSAEQKQGDTTSGPSAHAMAVEPSAAPQGALMSNVPSSSSQQKRALKPWGWPSVGAFALTPAFNAVSLPRVDVLEKPESFVVNCDLPGVSKENVKVSVTPEGVLSISAEHSKQKEQKDDSAKYHRIERSYGKFKRSLQLPDTVDADSINAKHENGLLQVTLPKKPKVETKGRDISIL